MLYKRIFLLIISIIICLSFCSCKNKELVFTYESSDLPQNIDPQLALTDSELIVVKNTFEGLFRLTEDNIPVPAAAKRYSISDDKTVYTFYLDQNAKWSDGTVLSANDFEFAIKRAADPKTKAPFANHLRIIKGAAAALEGLSSSESIGVTAVDTHTLRIELTEKCDNFTKILTQSVFMPCNKNFFVNCKGKYGLSKKHILTNGSFAIKQWNKDESVKLVSSKTYFGKFTSYASCVYITQPDLTQKDSIIERINSNKVDMARINYLLLDEAEQNNIKTIQHHTTSYVIKINDSSSVGSILNMKKALSLSVNREAFSSNLPKHFIYSERILPKDCILDNVAVSDYSKSVKYNCKYLPNEARALFVDSIKMLPSNKFPSVSILCEDNPAIKAVLTNIISSWQQNLGAYINIETVSSLEALQSRINSGEYTIAFMPVSSTDGTANSVISNLTYIDEPTIAETILLCEQTLLDSFNIIPVMSVPSVFAYSENLESIKYDFFTALDFSFIK